MLLGFVRPVEGVEIDRKLNEGVAVERRVRRHPLIRLERELRLLHRLVKIGQREQRHRMGRREIERELQIDEADILAPAPSERGAETIQHLGRARLRGIDQTGGSLPPFLIVSVADVISGCCGSCSSNNLKIFSASSLNSLRDAQLP